MDGHFVHLSNSIIMDVPDWHQEVLGIAPVGPYYRRPDLQTKNSGFPGVLFTQPDLAICPGYAWFATDNTTLAVHLFLCLVPIIIHNEFTAIHNLKIKDQAIRIDLRVSPVLGFLYR